MKSNWFRAQSQSKAVNLDLIAGMKVESYMSKVLAESNKTHGSVRVSNDLKDSYDLIFTSSTYHIICAWNYPTEKDAIEARDEIMEIVGGIITNG